ncbi:MAG: CooT family nickel-binding protein [Proteobacteria bacterium]|nr:CooT family nickel-binding protein [Pseudomonadota bacterium]
MCEANAYIMKDGSESLFMESVDLMEPMDDQEFLLTSIFGEQKTIKGRILFMNLVNHKMVFEPMDSMK